MDAKMYRVEIKTIGGNTAIADDTVKEGQGVAAYGAVKTFRAVNFIDENDREIFIPYHAIDVAITTTTMQAITPAQDAVCPTPTP